ncbi:hypothetical protein BJV82DRAFT_611840 [Fennellomyces sp. T-0311]|nr:hypothetical protein BJV82DRAFT_611840 [Fennellomyces sp. T-0311]
MENSRQLTAPSGARIRTVLSTMRILSTVMQQHHSTSLSVAFRKLYLTTIYPSHPSPAPTTKPSNSLPPWSD